MMVSCVLNGYFEVFEDMWVCVQQVVEKYNYKLNICVKSFVIGCVMVIGYVILIILYYEMVSNLIFGDFVFGVSEVYFVCGFDMNLIVVEIECEEYVYCQIKNCGSVDGIVVYGFCMEDLCIFLLQEIGLLFVVYGCVSSDILSYSWVDVNNCCVFKCVIDFLFDLGYSKIVLFNGFEYMDFVYC